MEKCKFCQAELAENGTFCPACGRNNAEEITEEITEETAAAEEAAVEESVAEEAEEEAAAEEVTEAEEAELPAEPEKKPVTPGKIALAVGAVVVLAAALIALVSVGLKGKGAEEAPNAATETTAAVAEAPAPTVPADGNPDDVTCKGTYTVSDEEAVAARETVVATIGDNQLTNGQLQVYYWSMVNNYLNSEYGYYMMMYGALNYAQPLDTQLCAEDQSKTWQQYFLGEALNYWQMCIALAEEAKVNGVEMSDADREYLENLRPSLEEAAASYGITLEEMLRNNFGPGAAYEDLEVFQSTYGHGKDFYAGKLEEMKPTQEELEAFFDERAETYESAGVTKDGKYVDVRHILVKVEGGTTDVEGVTTYSDEEWAACEAEATAIMNQWLEGDKTEDSFAALANEKSEDPGSNTNGGLYENVYVGQMVEPFETWCFDESRAYGDYGLVKTSYGYHVMFYVGSEPMWITYAENDWITEKSGQFLESLSAAYPMEAAFDKMALGYISLGA